MPFIRLAVGQLETNCYIVYDRNKRGAVIDPGDEGERILSALEDNGITVERILLTHVHFDHMMAAGQIKKATGADLLVPREDAAALSDISKNLGYMTGVKDMSLKADGMFGDGDVIRAGQLEFKVIHTPGHTPGSSCFACGDLLLTGDTLFAGGFGRTDFTGGDNRAMRRSLSRLNGLDRDYTVLPGHGQATTLENERRVNPYMRAI